MDEAVSDGTGKFVNEENSPKWDDKIGKEAVTVSILTGVFRGMPT